MLTLALRAIGYKALTKQADPLAVYNAIASAVNDAHMTVEVMTRLRPRTTEIESPHFPERFGTSIASDQTSVVRRYADSA